MRTMKTAASALAITTGIAFAGGAAMAQDPASCDAKLVEYEAALGSTAASDAEGPVTLTDPATGQTVEIHMAELGQIEQQEIDAALQEARIASDNADSAACEAALSVIDEIVFTQDDGLGVINGPVGGGSEPTVP